MNCFAVDGGEGRVETPFVGQVLASLVGFAAAVVDHCRVKEQLRVLGAKLDRAVGGFVGFAGFIFLVEGPGQGVPGVDVLPPLAVIRVNQSFAPNDFSDNGSSWKNLAIVTISDSELVVGLSNDADQYVIADAIRVQAVT